jgi:hypothetical protein
MKVISNYFEEVSESNFALFVPFLSISMSHQRKTTTMNKKMKSPPPPTINTQNNTY